jgi:hypothetical protein
MKTMSTEHTEYRTRRVPNTPSTEHTEYRTHHVPNTLNIEHNLPPIRFYKPSAFNQIVPHRCILYSTAVPHRSILYSTAVPHRCILYSTAVLHHTGTYTTAVPHHTDTYCRLPEEEPPVSKHVKTFWKNISVTKVHFVGLYRTVTLAFVISYSPWRK